MDIVVWILHHRKEGTVCHLISTTCVLLQDLWFGISRVANFSTLLLCSVTRLVVSCFARPCQLCYDPVVLSPSHSTRRSVMPRQWLCGAPALSCRSASTLITRAVRPTGNTRSDSVFIRAERRNERIKHHHHTSSAASPATPAGLPRQALRPVRQVRPAPDCL